MANRRFIQTWALVVDTFREAMARKIIWGFFGCSTALILFFLLIVKIDVVQGAIATMSLFGKTGQAQALWQQDAYRMIQRRAAAVGIETKIGNHTFRATGITAYLRNKGTLEHAQTIANHASPRTTKLYDRRSDEISLDEVEKISI